LVTKPARAFLQQKPLLDHHFVERGSICHIGRAAPCHSAPSGNLRPTATLQRDMLQANTKKKKTHVLEVEEVFIMRRILVYKTEGPLV
jgi:hypothetical protein